ncbi:MAG: DUF885 family protein [Gammaproteobacteria bacterium]|nr:DUF885 family protein [Gammaproteobacteria bacterium]
MNRLAFLYLSGLLLLPACQTTPSQVEKGLESDELVQTVTKESDENAKASAFFEQAFTESLNRAPMYQSYLGIKDQQDLWDDLSEEKAWQDIDVTMRQLARLKSEIDRGKLNEQTRISYDLFVKNAENEIANFRWRHHNYPINQMHGWQSWIPSFLINIHRVSEKQDALDYISRLDGIAAVVTELIKKMDKREAMGIVPPLFVFPRVISDSENVLKGSPFEDSEEDSTLLSDFKDKVNALEITQLEKHVLIDQAKNVLLDSVGPAYRSLIDRLKQQQKIATTDDGAWKLPNGDDFYNAALRNTTTTKLTAEEIHNIGLREVARIHEEMRSIMQEVGFKGSLQDFFAFTRKDEQFYYPQSEQGRQAYLEKAKSIINTMKTRLDEMFITKPKADISVKAVEPFREKSAGKAFYQRGTPDGSRPGVYYANLYRMSDMPNYQMEALAYHEGIPGHHMQGSIASELEGIPRFRKFGHYTAYGEGWGLYSEYLPKEMGFYSDPYSDFGRLAMEIWRACRLVVDTGIHAKRWTREQAIEYLEENTPNPRGDIVKAIERYIVIPSQATAYKIGMNKILELRTMTEEILGEKFNLREFHDVVLRNGPLPLDMLEDSVKVWVHEVKGSEN